MLKASSLVSSVASYSHAREETSAPIDVSVSGLVFSFFFSLFFFPYPTRVDRSSTTDWCNCVTGSSSKVTDRPSWPPPSRRAHNVCKYVDEATVRIPPDILPYKRRRFLTGSHCPAIGLTIKTIVSGSSWNYLSCWEIGGGIGGIRSFEGRCIWVSSSSLGLNIFFFGWNFN